MKILHLFADDGVEAEPLSAYGQVYRVGIDPYDSEWTSELAAVDLRKGTPPWARDFDIGLGHPPCYKWTQRRDEDGENLIPRARTLLDAWCDDWIIENQPDAPLDDPVVLSGDMFGLPVEYERAFETSYHIDQPAGTGRRPRHRVECTRPKAYWKSVKGVTGDYRSDPLITSGTPAAYIHYLVRPLLDGFEYELGHSQTKLTEATAEK